MKLLETLFSAVFIGFFMCLFLVFNDRVMGDKPDTNMVFLTQTFGIMLAVGVIMYLVLALVRQTKE